MQRRPSCFRFMQLTQPAHVILLLFCSDRINYKDNYHDYLYPLLQPLPKLLLWQLLLLQVNTTITTTIKEELVIDAFAESDMEPQPRSQQVKTLAAAVCKIQLIFLLLYIFVCSLDILSSAFQLAGGEGSLKWHVDTVMDAQLRCFFFLNWCSISFRQSSGGYLSRKCHPVQPSGWTGGGDTGDGVGPELLHLNLHHSQPRLLRLWVTA